MENVLYFESDQEFQGLKFEAGKEYPICEIGKRSNGVAFSCVCQGRTIPIGSWGFPVYYQGIEKAILFAKEDDEAGLISHIKSLYGFGFDWLEKEINENSPIEDLRELALLQILDDFTNRELFVSDQEREKRFVNAMKSTFSY